MLVGFDGGGRAGRDRQSRKSEKGGKPVAETSQRASSSAKPSIDISTPTACSAARTEFSSALPSGSRGSLGTCSASRTVPGASCKKILVNYVLLSKLF